MKHVLKVQKGLKRRVTVSFRAENRETGEDKSFGVCEGLDNRWPPCIRSQWPRGVRRGSAAARVLALRAPIPPGHGCLSVVSVVCF